MERLSLVRPDGPPPAGQRPDDVTGRFVAPVAGHRTFPSIAGQVTESLAPATATAPVTGQRPCVASRAERASKERVTRATTVAPRSQVTIRERLGLSEAFISDSLRAGRPPGWDAVSTPLARGSPAVLGDRTFPLQYRR